MSLLIQNISRLSQSARIIISNLSPMQQRFRARKGTRERKLKKKVKKEVIKQAWMPVVKSKSKLAMIGPVRLNEDLLTDPPDNVWFLKSYKRPVYSFEEAVRLIKEVHHPTIFNQPNSLLSAYVELNMSTAKKTKFVDRFTRLVGMPYPYDHGEERTVLAFCKDTDLIREANEAGASLSGGTSIIKAIDKGQIVLPDFQFVVAHPSIIPELVPLRPMLKKNFPSINNGTLDVDIAGLVKKCLTGIRYTCLRHELEQDYGWVDTPLGPLTMKPAELEANLIEIIKDIDTRRPKRDGDFITRVMLSTPLVTERLWINWSQYIDQPEDLDSDDDEDEPAVKAA